MKTIFKNILQQKHKEIYEKGFCESSGISDPHPAAKYGLFDQNDRPVGHLYKITLSFYNLILV